METRLMGPNDASAVGRLKIPTPTMLPTISAAAAMAAIRRRAKVERLAWRFRAQSP
jgi:hypothetical protein